MWIDMRFFRSGGFSTMVYERDGGSYAHWFSHAWHVALDEQIDREIKERTRKRLAEGRS